MGGYMVWQNRETAKNASLAQPRTWPAIRIEALENAELKLSTMWREGALHYQLSIDGYPKIILATRDIRKDRVSSAMRPEFTIEFLDENGFKLFEHEIPLNKMAKIVNAKGQGVGLEAKGHTYLTAETYRRAASWNITWNFDTQP